MNHRLRIIIWWVKSLRMSCIIMNINLIFFRIIANFNSVNMYTCVIKWWWERLGKLLGIGQNVWNYSLISWEYHLITYTNIMGDELHQQLWIFDIILYRIDWELHSLKCSDLKCCLSTGFSKFFDKIPIRILLDVLFCVFKFSKASFCALTSSFKAF